MSRFQSFFLRSIIFPALASLSILSVGWDRQDRLRDRFKAQYSDNDMVFDFVIVGGGNGGATLASRLSESKFKVLLLESGGEPNPISRVPQFTFPMLNHPESDWRRKTVPQKNACTGLRNGQTIVHGGKSLGGSTNLGYMIHLRGSPKDWDNIARISKDSSWSYQELLPYFRKSENFQVRQGGMPMESHSQNGPLSIETPRFFGLSNFWLRAGNEQGYRREDLNGDFDEGFDKIYTTTKLGRRWSAFNAFIENERKRPNLHIYKFSTVRRILIKGRYGEEKKAYGVIYERHGKKKFAIAKREVILSAGAIHTPQLLMLSGIGQATHLTKMEIPVSQALPVGQNLQDSLSTIVGPFFTNKGKTFLLDRDLKAKQIFQFRKSGFGPFSTTGLDATALLTSVIGINIDGQIGWPDVELTLWDTAVHSTFIKEFSRVFNFRPEILQEFLAHAEGKDAFFVVVTSKRPRSRGEVLLRNLNPRSPPLIDPNYLSHDLDREVIVDGIRKSLDLVENSTAFQNDLGGVRLSSKPFPGCETQSFGSDEYWRCYIRHMSFSFYNNFVGTCAMGYEGYPYAVVNSELKVIGINSLRVVDASILPVSISGGTQAAVYVIAEKAADLIKKEYMTPKSPQMTFLKSLGFNLKRRMLDLNGTAENENEEEDFTEQTNFEDETQATTTQANYIGGQTLDLDETPPSATEFHNFLEDTQNEIDEEVPDAQTIVEERVRPPPNFDQKAAAQNNPPPQRTNAQNGNRNNNNRRRNDENNSSSSSSGKIIGSNTPELFEGNSEVSPPRQGSRVSSIYDNFDENRRRDTARAVQPIDGHSLPKLYFHPENKR